VPIASLDDYISSNKQYLNFCKVSTRTAVLGQPFSVFDLAGATGAGVLAGTNAVNGFIPTDASAGYPDMTTFTTGAHGYLSRVISTNSVACRISIVDRLWVAGTHAYNANVTYTAQPSYASRVPSGDYSGLKILVECVTAINGSPSFNVSYINQAGEAKSTGATAVGGTMTVGRLFEIALAPGDTGVQRINSIVGSGGSSGTFNLSVVRPLWDGRVAFANDGDNQDMLRTGMPEVFDLSALYMIVTPDTTNTGTVSLSLEIASK